MRGYMKRLVFVVGLTVLFLALNVLAADQAGGIFGTWILNVEKSDPAPIPITNLGAPGLSSSGAGGMRGGGGMGPGMGGGRGGPMPGGPMPGGEMPGGRGRGAGSAQKAKANLPLIIVQLENQIRIARTVMMNGKETNVIEVYQPDGKEKVETFEVPNAKEPVKTMTKATLKKNKLEIRSVTPNPQGKYEVKKEYSISKDGKVLTVKTTTRNQMGLNVFDTVQKQFYEKQQGNE
jgi:hypothetical protein